MYNTRTIEVNADFIADALYSRFYEVKDRRGSRIHELKIDELVDLICDCGTLAGSASEIIDNRLINGESGTYEEIWNYNFSDERDYKGTDEQMEKIEDYCMDNCYMYDRDLEEYCSY